MQTIAELFANWPVHGKLTSSVDKLYFPNLQAETPAELDALEADIEKAVLAGLTIVINCAARKRARGKTPHGNVDSITRAGCVPLRWGAPRILLVSPADLILIQDKQELQRAWRLWRYQFDPNTDGVIGRAPTIALNMLRKAAAEAAKETL